MPSIALYAYAWLGNFFHLIESLLWSSGWCRCGPYWGEEGNNHSCHGATRQYRRRRYFVHHMCRFSMTKRNNEAKTRKTFFLQSSSPLLLTYLCCKRVLGDLWCAPAKYCGSDCFCSLVTHCTYINSALNNNDGGDEVTGSAYIFPLLHFSLRWLRNLEASLLVTIIDFGNGPFSDPPWNLHLLIRFIFFVRGEFSPQAKVTPLWDLASQ